MATANPSLGADELLRRLECPVCQEQYRKPKILPCGHTLCQSPCLDQISCGKTRFNCPECRAEHAVPKSGVSGFLTNIAISRMSEEVPEIRHAIHGCPLCGEDESLVKCFHCDLVICEECKIDHTPRFRNQMLDLAENLQRDINNAASACDDLESNLKEQVRATAGRASSEVDMAIKKLFLAVEEKLAEMKRKVKIFTEEEIQNINIQRNAINKDLEKSATFCETIKKEVQSEGKLSHTQLAKMKKSYTEHMEIISRSKYLMKQLQRSISTRFDFEAVTTDVANFGDIIISDDQTKFNDGPFDKATPNPVLIKILETPFTMPKQCFGSPGAGFGNLSKPTGIALDPNNKDVLIADTDNHRVQVFDKEGEFKASFGSYGKGDSHFYNPVGIILSKQGNVFVSDMNSYRVKVHDIHGVFIRSFGQYGSGDGMFNYPSGLAQDPKENIHVCDVNNKRVQVFNENGTYKCSYNSWKAVADEIVCKIAITPSGQIGIQLDKTVVVLNTNLQLLSIFPWNTASFGGICFIDDDHILMSDKSKHTVKVYTTKGDLLKESGTQGHCVGELQKPKGLAIDGSDVYVVCGGSNIIQKF